MSRVLSQELPPDLLTRLSGRDLASVASKVIQLVTVDAAGWPHPALLSYFEVIARDARRIRLATYAGSTTSANMRNGGKVTLVLIDERVAYYIKGRAMELEAKMRTTGWNAAFECQVEQVLADQANEEFEPGAYLATGVTYHNPQRAAEMERAHAVLAELMEDRTR